MNNQLATKQSETSLTVKLKKFPRIRDLKNTVPIQQALAHVWIQIGLNAKNWPNKENGKEMEYNILINFIRESYGGLIAEEIKDAFDLGCQGKLNVDMNNYQSFPCEYLGRVMNAYSVWRAKELQNTGRSFLPERKKLDSAERLEWYNQMLLDPYQELLAGKPYKFTEQQELNSYRLLENMGFEIMTLDDKKQLWEESKSHFTHVRLPDQREKKMSKWCRQQAFKEWIQGCAMEKRDLEKEIKEKLTNKVE